jgi:hypothetical protein
MLNHIEANRKVKKLYITPILLVSLGLIAFIFIYWITSNGTGISDDSVYYLTNAQSLITNRGFSPTAHFPPAYPVLLAIVGFFQQGDLLKRLVC